MGETHPSYIGNTRDMRSALMDTNYGPGISSINILQNQDEEASSFNDFKSYISTMNSKNIDTLYILVSAHGFKNGLALKDDLITANDFADSIASSTAQEINMIITSCYSGSLVDELQDKINVEGYIITAADSNHRSKRWVYEDNSDGNSFIIEDFANFLVDPATDTNQDHENDFKEVFNRVRSHGRPESTIGMPVITDYESYPIPTLSEWKQIFLTLFMLSLVMGFMRTTHSTFALSNGSIMHKITGANLLVFNKKLFYPVLKWLGSVVIFGFAGVIVVFGHVKMLDIIGTLFCAPLVAYILHLVISFVHDCEGISG
jgi:hypothetical protein